MKVENNPVMLAPEWCESKQNWLSYDFFEKTCSGGGDGDDPKSLHQVMHQNTLFWKNHNLMSFARIHMIFYHCYHIFLYFHPMYLQKNKKAWHCAWQMIQWKDEIL